MSTRRALRRLRAVGAEIVLVLVMVVVGITLWQAFETAQHLRTQARDASRIYGRFIAAFGDTAPGIQAGVLLSLAADIRASGLPLVITDSSGRPSEAANVPGDLAVDDPALRDYVRRLDRTHPPIEVPSAGLLVHYGALPAERRLTWLALLQLGALATAAAVGLWAYRSASHRDRERLWVAMARESAHQLGTPLMSAAAWIDRLAKQPGVQAQVIDHLRGDLERLERVVQRFERIGRPARRARVALGALVERVARYFIPRLPTRANAIDLRVDAPSAGPAITADPVLLEWALEALIRNSVDALSGRGGSIRVTVRGRPHEAEVTVADNGPGIPAEVWTTLFEPGVTTKTGGWGIGLALARRIVEDVHGGKLELVPAETGAVFVARLPAGRMQDPDAD